MNRTHLSLASVALFATAMMLFGCSSSNNSNPMSGGGGGGKEFDSGTVAPGGTFSHVFMTAKVVPYHCLIHGAAMSGTITVQAAGTPILHTVSMTASSTFSPAALTVNVGDTVKWVNNSAVNHTATSDI
jgi:plastocyanin